MSCIRNELVEGTPPGFTPVVSRDNERSAGAGKWRVSTAGMSHASQPVAAPSAYPRYSDSQDPAPHPPQVRSPRNRVSDTYLI